MCLFWCVTVWWRFWRNMALRSPSHTWRTARTVKRRPIILWSNCAVTRAASMNFARTTVMNTKLSMKRPTSRARLMFACVPRTPLVGEAVWRGLLEDLLNMQQNAYTCLKPETCHQVSQLNKMCRILRFVLELSSGMYATMCLEFTAGKQNLGL